MSQPTPSSTPNRAGVSPAAVIVIVLAAALLVGGAFFAEEIQGFVKLRGWDRDAPKRIVADFISASHSKDNSKVASLMDPGVFTIEKDNSGKVKTVSWRNTQGGATKKTSELIPKGDPKAMEVVTSKKGDELYYVVVVQFGNNKWGVMRVGPSKTGIVIQGLPEAYDTTKPTDLTFY